MIFGINTTTNHAITYTNPFPTPRKKQQIILPLGPDGPVAPVFPVGPAGPGVPGGPGGPAGPTRTFPRVL